MSARRPSQFSVGSGPQPPSGTKGKIFQRRGRKPAPSPSSSPDRRVPQLTFSSEQKKPLSSVLIRDEQGQPTTRTLEEMRTRATALRTELRNMANLQIQITDADAERKIHGRGLAARLMDKEEFRMDELKDKDINYILRARQPKDQTEAAFVLDDEDIIMTKMIQIAEEKLKKYRAVRSAITEAASDEIKETTDPVHPTAVKFSGFVEVAKSALANKKWKETIISIGELIQELESQTNQLLHENTLKKVEGEKIMAEFLKRERSIRSEIDRITEELQIANSKNNSAFQKEEVKMQHFREMCTDLNKQIRFIHDDIARKTVQPMVSKDLQNGFEQVKKERETLESQKKEILVLYEREYKKLLERNEKYETDIANTKSGIDDSLRHRKELQAQFDLGKSEILQQSKELVNIKRENARMKELYATSSYTITGSGLRRQGESNRDIVYRNMKLPYPANMLEVPLSPRYPVGRCHMIGRELSHMTVWFSFQINDQTSIGLFVIIASI
eukprot:TRINITY_DN4240_c0_g1_i6.p1 TRINITY_DN4240_c0_g1~~TRINITY_DN4240_c0_g1_i6.p1  ORF type:complete len:502 (+),score=111.71 TRINITY_DN4240_c0_g1_i6:44-1549(+)